MTSSLLCSEKTPPSTHGSLPQLNKRICIQSMTNKMFYCFFLLSDCFRILDRKPERLYINIEWTRNMKSKLVIIANGLDTSSNYFPIVATIVQHNEFTTKMYWYLETTSSVTWRTCTMKPHLFKEINKRHPTENLWDIQGYKNITDHQFMAY